MAAPPVTQPRGRTHLSTRPGQNDRLSPASLPKHPACQNDPLLCRRLCHQRRGFIPAARCHREASAKTIVGAGLGQARPFSPSPCSAKWRDADSAPAAPCRGQGVSQQLLRSVFKLGMTGDGVPPLRPLFAGRVAGGLLCAEAAACAAAQSGPRDTVRCESPFTETLPITPRERMVIGGAVAMSPPPRPLFYQSLRRVSEPPL